MRSGGACFGYGRAFREYPQAQLQQQGQRPLAPVGPPEIRYEPPWELEAALWAALGASSEVSFRARPSAEPQVGVPVRFPPLGQWQPDTYDPPDAYVAERNFLKAWFARPFSGPAVPFPALGQWVPVTQPLDESYMSFRLWQLPIVNPPQAARLIPPWWGEAASWAALGASAEVVYQVYPGGQAVGAPPVRFPNLGQWQPVTQPLDEAYYLLRVPLAGIGEPPVGPEAYQRALANWAALGALQELVLQARPQLPFVGPPPVSFPRLGQWQPQPLYLDESYYSLRLRLLPIANPVPPLPPFPAWAMELQNWASLSAVQEALYFERPMALPPEQAVSFPKLGQWMPTTQPLDEAYYSLRQRLMPVGPGPAGPDAWEGALANWSALSAAQQAIYLTQPSGIPVTSAPAFPRLGQWQPFLITIDEAYYSLRQRLLPVVPESPPFPVQLVQLPNWAALSAASQLVIAQQGIPFMPAQAVLFPKLGQWMPTTQPLDEAFYSLRQRLLGIPEAPTGTPAWLSELAQWAGLSAATEALYQVQGSYPPYPQQLTSKPLGQWVPKALPLDLSYYSLRQPLLPVVPESPPLPAWVPAQENLAALLWQSGYILQVRQERKPDELPAAQPNPQRAIRQAPLDLSAVLAQLRARLSAELPPAPPVGQWIPRALQLDPSFLQSPGKHIQQQESLPWSQRLHLAAYNRTPQDVRPYGFRLPTIRPWRIWVWDAAAATWRESVAVSVWDTTGATWRLAKNLWVYDAAAGVWRQAT